jgi:hypothetical protein
VSSTLTLPTTISSEAAARVADLGFQHAADALLTQARGLLAGLQSIHLSLVPSYEMDEVPWLVLECTGDRPECQARDGLLAWYTWRAENLPFEVARHFMLEWIEQQAGHAG